MALVLGQGQSISLQLPVCKSHGQVCRILIILQAAKAFSMGRDVFEHKTVLRAEALHHVESVQ